MIKYHWSYTCDRCGTLVDDDYEFDYGVGESVCKPLPIPDPLKYPGWRVLDTDLICPAHVVQVVDRLEPVSAE